jgi:hypothetical protein
MTWFLWVAVAVMLLGVAMVLSDLGAPGLWLPIIAIAMASFVIDARRERERVRW